MKNQSLLLGCACLGTAVLASAQTDVLSLQNSPQQNYTFYSFDITATNTTTWVTFLMRQDPAYWALDDISLASASNPGNNLLLNGGFESGDLTGWESVGQPGLPAAGRVATSGYLPATAVPHSGTYYWYDGAVGGVDGIGQSITTTVGLDYIFSFWLAADGGSTASFDAITGARVASFNGTPILYNGEVPPDGGTVNTPEPSALVLAALSGLGLFLSCRRKS